PYLWALMLGCSLSVGACSSLPKGQADLDVGMKERGIASWYGDDFHGWVTANGEIYDMYALTGAHRTLPLGTVVRVTNVVNGRQVKIRINDRGPYVKGRILDLSYKAAEELYMVRDGVSAVYLEVIGHESLDALPSDHHLLNAGEHSTTESSEIGSDPFTRAPQRPAPMASRSGRHVRQIPGDVLRERRLRRAGDILAVGQRVDATAGLVLS
ncbi:MAG: septal ring lytic transglycosylase RlpA family protein, partial [Nitrospiraceae bacterium]